MSSPWPFLTNDLPGVGGTIKRRVEDFRVDEIPLYDACGEGTHVYFRIEKRGIPTPVAVERLAHHMNVRAGDIGVAGLKDAQALTTQTLSLEHADPEKLIAYHDHQMRVLEVSRHGNKLRPGHLAGNRFAIKIRDVSADALDPARAILDVLTRRGVPNYFGPQRFGLRGDTADLGEAIVRDDLDEFIHIFLGRPNDADPPDCRAARDAFEVGAMDRALKRWPRHYADQRKALAAYKKKHNPRHALNAIDKRMKRLFVSAFQSAIFNDVLARRIDTLDVVLAGDLAQKTDTGGIFPVEDPAVEQPRAAAFEISPTGPLPGYRERLAGGEPGKIEQDVIAARCLDLESLNKLGPLKVKGARRALRFPLHEPNLSAGADEQGPYLELTFTAPSGCYATIAVEEICKTG
ncbi:MAG: tRNA pseudouridine(13) synthase TruD [Phycisphaerae bacterium]|nr:tRNA pseudouridine(13) synthase TruD [Phycisphaerae bacterium]